MQDDAGAPEGKVPSGSRWVLLTVIIGWGAGDVSGRFSLADHNWDESYERIVAASEGQDIKLLIPEMGEVIDLDNDKTDQAFLTGGRRRAGQRNSLACAKLITQALLVLMRCSDKNDELHVQPFPCSE
ncbi:hypothetical protein [Pseudomonas sp. VD9]|mgnify:CR=1 FL=1|uniref:hypothetical protein n=1 Tax=Pseudomonas sp. VD9 TaxID=3342076 RepID=UPI003C6C800A